MLKSLYFFFEMSYEERKSLPDNVFALPNRRYPIHDKKHARLALAMVNRYGTPDEKLKVRSKVYKKYPELRKI